ncbi:MAG: hypothetical protein R2747_18125 [Pyrinomonadaceae bacterium]
MKKRPMMITGLVIGIPLFTIALILFAIIGWFEYSRPKTGIYETATVERKGAYYEITLKREERLMCHSPDCLIFPETYTNTLVIKTPGITGKVDASEIPAEEYHFNYLGEIEFKENNEMIVDLYYDNTDENKKVPTGWSGQYKLVFSSRAVSKPGAEFFSGAAGTPDGKDALNKPAAAISRPESGDRNRRQRM